MSIGDPAQDCRFGAGLFFLLTLLLTGGVVPAQGRGPAGGAAAFLSPTGAAYIVLEWADNAHNEDGFEVLRQGPGESAFTAIGTVPANVVSYTDNDVAYASTYCYQVVAFNVIGRSDPSGTACATTVDEPSLPSAPSAPKELRVSYDGRRSIHLNWTDVSGNEIGFDILRSRDGDRYRSIATVGANAVYYQDNAGSRNNRVYCYRVVAYNAVGSAASGEVCVVTDRLTGGNDERRQRP